MPSLGDLIVNVAANIVGFKTAMTDVSNTATDAAKTADAAASKINAVFSAAFGAGITGLALSAANKFDAAFAQIQRSTGATDEKLQGLEQSFQNVYKQTAASSEAVASTLSLLSTRTQATGKDLEDLTLKTIKLAKTQSEDVATIVPKVTQLFGAWGIATQDQAKAMDYLRVVSQQTATPVSALTEELVKQMPQLQALGYNWQQASVLIGNFEKSGAAAQGALVALKTVLKNFEKEGVVDFAAEWQKLVKGVQDGTVSLGEFMKVAGSKGGAALFEAIRQHNTDVADLTKKYQDLADKGGASIETMRTKVTKWTHEVESLIASHKDLVIAIGLALPVLTNLAGLFRTLGTVALPAIANIATAVQYNLVGALTLGEKALFAFSVPLAGIAVLCGAAVLAVNGLRDALNQLDGTKIGIWSGILEALKNSPLTSGLGVAAEIAATSPSGFSKATAPGEFSGGLSEQRKKKAPAPAPGGGLTGSGGGKDQTKKEFAALGLPDLEAQLEAATKAYDALTAAGKLNDGQMQEAQKHIADLRGQIAALASGLGDRKTTFDLLKTLGIDDEAQVKVGKLGAALADLTQRMQTFVGPQTVEQQQNLTEAWLAYGRAVLAAKEAHEKAQVPYYDAIKAQNDENAALQASIDELNSLPPVIHGAMDPMNQLFGAITGVTDAFHYFGMATQTELDVTARKAKEQYEIIKNSGVASATDIQIAWTKMMIAQIDADQELKDSDLDLWTQRKKNAEDALKKLEGDDKNHTETIKKNHYDLGNELESMSHRTFDSLEKDLAKDIVQWKGWSDTIKNIGTTFATDFLGIMLKGLFKPLEDEFAKLAGKIGGALGGIFGGGSSAAGTAASTAGSAASTAGSAAGGVASAAGSVLSSVTGVVGAVGSVVSAVSGIIFGIQQAKDMDTLANHTLRIYNELSYFRQDAWTREEHWYARTADMWQTELDIKDLLGQRLPAAGGGGTGGSATTNIFNFYSADIDQITAKLKAAGVYV